MSDFQADSLQIGNIGKAIYENTEGQLVFRDKDVPQGVVLENLYQDLSFAQDLADNNRAFLYGITGQIVTTIANSISADARKALTLAQAVSAAFDNFTIEATLGSNVVTTDKLNVLQHGQGIGGTPTGGAVLKIENDPVESGATNIQIHNKYPLTSGPTPPVEEYTSRIRFNRGDLRIENLEKNTFTLAVKDGTTDVSKITLDGNGISMVTTGVSGGFTIVDDNVTRLEFEKGTGFVSFNEAPITSHFNVSGTEQIGTTLSMTISGLNVVSTSGSAFTEVLEGAEILANGGSRLVKEKQDDNNIILDEPINWVGTFPFTFRNPIVNIIPVSGANFLVNGRGNVGINTIEAQEKLHIKGGETPSTKGTGNIFIEDTDGRILFANRDDIYGSIGFKGETSENELILGSYKLNEGAEILLDAIDTNYTDPSGTSSGLIIFKTNPFKYQDSQPNREVGRFTPSGNLGLDTTKPRARLHVVGDTDHTLGTGTVNISAGSSVVIGDMSFGAGIEETRFETEIAVDDYIKINGQERRVASVTNDYLLTVTTPFVSGGDHFSWEQSNAIARFDTADGTTIFKIVRDGWYLSGPAAMDWTPGADNTYSLGTSANRWKDLWVNGSSIHIGGTTISAPSGGTLSIDGVDLATSVDISGVQTQVNNVRTKVNTVSASLNEVISTTLAGLSGDVQSSIDDLRTDLVTVSGNLQSNIDGLRSEVVTVSGNLQSNIDGLRSEVVTVSGNLQSNIDTLDGTVNTRLANVSGALDSSLVHLTGDEVIGGNKDFSGDIVIQGTLTIAGSATTLTTQNVLAENNTITVNYGETGTGVTSISAGIRIDRGLANDYFFLFHENDQAFKIGENPYPSISGGQLQAVSTREDNPNTDGVAHWDVLTNKFITTSDVTISGGHLVLGSPMIPTVSGGVDIGTSDRPFRDLYLTHNSLHLGSNVLSVSGGILNLNGEKVGGSDANELAGVGIVPTSGGKLDVDFATSVEAISAVNETKSMTPKTTNDVLEMHKIQTLNLPVLSGGTFDITALSGYNSDYKNIRVRVTGSPASSVNITMPPVSNTEKHIEIKDANGNAETITMTILPISGNFIDEYTVGDSNSFTFTGNFQSQLFHSYNPTSKWEA